MLRNGTSIQVNKIQKKIDKWKKNEILIFVVLR